MTKQEQISINNEILEAVNDFNTTHVHYDSVKRLRTCNARVFIGKRYIVLMSYYTIVAFIDLEKRKLYDILRYNHGYTATSAQHISKFSHDYSGWYDFLRYRPV